MNLDKGKPQKSFSWIFLFSLYSKYIELNIPPFLSNIASPAWQFSPLGGDVETKGEMKNDVGNLPLLFTFTYMHTPLSHRLLLPFAVSKVINGTLKNNKKQIDFLILLFSKCLAAAVDAEKKGKMAKKKNV